MQFAETQLDLSTVIASQEINSNYNDIIMYWTRTIFQELPKQKNEKQMKNKWKTNIKTFFCVDWVDIVCAVKLSIRYF